MWTNTEKLIEKNLARSIDDAKIFYREEYLNAPLHVQRSRLKSLRYFDAYKLYCEGISLGELATMFSVTRTNMKTNLLSTSQRVNLYRKLYDEKNA